MFENQNMPAGSQNQGVNPSGSQAGGFVPPNAAPQSVSTPAAKPAAPPDMFAETETASRAADFGQTPRSIPPKPAVFQPKPAAPLGAPAPYNFEEAAPKTDIKKLLVLGGLVLALAAIVGGGYWGYKKYTATDSVNTAPISDAKKEDNQAAADNQPVNTQAQPEVKTETQPVVPADNAAVTPGTSAAAVPKDSDSDGLTDEEEASLGTNLNSVDSDNDGLFDREEVKVYGTDPLKADTDGDSYSDGVEVKGGFNPLGWGRLFDAANPGVNKK